MALEDILYNRHCNPSKEFIGHLNEDMERMVKGMYPIEKLILEHTMYPQYARFIGAEQKKNAILHLGHDYCDAHHLFAILPRSEGGQWLKYCPLCAEEDRKLYGETYWHRKHQIRNMDVCARHKCRLENSIVSAKSEQCFTLDAAENNIQNTWGRTAESILELEFAAYLEEIFDAPMDFENDIPVSAILYFGMENTKYMSVSGKTRNTKQLADNMLEYFNKIGLDDIAGYYQIQRTLLGSRSDFSVVCQTAFFLGMPAEKLVNPKLSEEQIFKEKNARYPKKENLPEDWKQYDEEMVPIVEQAANDIYYGSINSMGRPERISERLINKYAGLPKHRLDNMPKCREVVRKYEETYAQHWARRVVWAYKKLKVEKGDSPIYWVDIRKLTGIKKKNFPKINPCLEEFTDRDTADAIRELLV